MSKKMLLRNQVDAPDVDIYVPLRDIRYVFELADRIAQMEVRYDPDQLKMANAAIKDMQDIACEIAAVISIHNR